MNLIPPQSYIMQRIRRLPEKIINQIAAGEVVERPFSVIKELVDNAIDAGSTQIEVRIEDGGKTKIQVRDNGCGISAADLPMAIERHATSKLSSENLNMVTTLGFRGEALPSIGSIANLRISSRVEGSDSGYAIAVSFGEVSDVEPCAHLQGTTVEVSDIFSQIPARLKFLRTDLSEKTAVQKVIEDFALSHPQIEFQLFANGKQSLNLPSASFDERVGAVLGADFRENTFAISHGFGSTQIRGRIGLSTYTKNNSSYQYFFVNGRVVKDKNLSQILRAAYKDVIMHGVYPVCVLFFELDPFDVDVNAHPAKTEVRFRDPQNIKSIFYNAVKTALKNAPLKTFVHAPSGLALKGNNQHFPSGRIFAPPKADYQSNFSEPFHAAIKPLSTYQAVYSQAAEVRETTQEYQLGMAICQIDNMYIIAQANDKLIVVDQHAAHERLVLEKIKLSAVKVQNLLVPIQVNLPQLACEALAAHTQNLQEYGLKLEVGEGVVQVFAVPDFMKKEDVAGLVRDIAESLMNDEAKDHVQDLKDEIMANIACKASIKAGRKLSLDEMNHILREIERTPLAMQCNHGRPTFVVYSSADLHKIFERA